jgi:DNA polymerase-3 subunit epsilon
MDIDFSAPWLPSPMVVFDTETTGTGAQDRVVEFGAVRFERGQAPQSHAFLINPQILMPYYAERVHGISDAMVARAPKIREVWPQIEAVFSGAFVLAHNLPFDRRMLEQEAERLGRTFAVEGRCTLKLAKRMHPERLGRGAHTLEGLSRLYGIPNPEAHRALGDAQATAHLLAAFVAQQPEVVREYFLDERL